MGKTSPFVTVAFFRIVLATLAYLVFQNEYLLIVKMKNPGPGVVAHTCNPSFEDCG
jgi:hypothetical protein